MKKAVVILAMGGALALSAQDVRLGVQGALSLPTSSLSDNASTGLQLGGHAKWDFRGGHGLMARADLTFYGQTNSISVNAIGVAADYTYHFEPSGRGPYLLAGLSQQNYRTSFPGYSRNDSGLGIDLGGGYELDRNLGLQARYTTNSYSNVTYSALNLGVTYTF